MTYVPQIKKNHLFKKFFPFVNSLFIVALYTGLGSHPSGGCVE